MVYGTCKSFIKIDNYSKIKRSFRICSIFTKLKSSLYKKTTIGSNLRYIRWKNIWIDIFQKDIYRSFWWSSKGSQSSKSNYRRIWNGQKIRMAQLYWNIICEIIFSLNWIKNRWLDSINNLRMLCPNTSNNSIEKRYDIKACLTFIKIINNRSTNDSRNIRLKTF